MNHDVDRLADPMAGAQVTSSSEARAEQPLFAENGSTEYVLLLRWLADLFANPPTAASLKGLRHGLAVLDAADDCDQPSEFSSAINSMSRCLSKDMDDEALAIGLSIAHGRLFLGIGGPETVPPYESFYRDDGRLFQAPTAEMERLLAAHNYSVAVSEAADHVSIELALLAALMEADHPDCAGLAERLMSWVPLFRDLLVRRDSTGFWSSAASVLIATVRPNAPCTDFFPST
jgi:TorA-specific chaperone